jgi:hypothetical protein
LPSPSPSLGCHTALTTLTVVTAIRVDISHTAVWVTVDLPIHSSLACHTAVTIVPAITAYTAIWATVGPTAIWAPAGHSCHCHSNLGCHTAVTTAGTAIWSDTGPTAGWATVDFPRHSPLGCHTAVTLITLLLVTGGIPHPTHLCPYGQHGPAAGGDTAWAPVTYCGPGRAVMQLFTTARTLVRVGYHCPTRILTRVHCQGNTRVLLVTP